MRAKMLVDARVLTEGAEDRVFSVDEEIEGPDAELQVGLGHAEALPEASSVAGESQPEILATQAALDHAEALGVDLAAIKGTGKDGRVTKADVEAAVSAQEST